MVTYLACQLAPHRIFIVRSLHTAQIDRGLCIQALDINEALKFTRIDPI